MRELPQLAPELYLDHASTSYPKPPVVGQAMAAWLGHTGVSASRGAGAAHAAVGAAVEEVRATLATMCGVTTSRLAYTSGATESIHLFFDGWLRPGMRVLTTALEHSSVARPLRARADIEVEVLRVPPSETGDALIARLSEQPPDLVVFSHASNVTGHVLDARALCAAARDAGALTLVDASQSIGHVPVDVGADALVASGHKALHGPPGIGILAVRDGVHVRPVKLGGTGSSTAVDTQPDEWPQALESGTPNTPAILGLGAALAADDGQRSAAALRHAEKLAAALRSSPRVRILGVENPAPRAPVFSLLIDGIDPTEAGILADLQGITVRTGYHCAPWIHDVLGTTAGGTVRISPGPTCDSDVAQQLAQTWGL